MAGLRPLARLYIAFLVTAAVVLTALGLYTVDSPDTEQLILIAAFTGLMILAGIFQLDYTFRQKLALYTAVIFAVALLFEPGIAMLIVGVGSITAHLWIRHPWFEAVFNGAQLMLQAGAASGLLKLAGWSYEPLRFSDPVHLALIPIAAAVIYLINTIAVAIIVALQTGLSPFGFWRQSIRYGDDEELAQFILGLLAAAIIDAHAWALALFLLPAVAIYKSLQRHTQLRQQTVDAVEALADVVDLRDPYTANHSRRVAIYARELATTLDLDVEEVDLIERAARVHDVGKVVIDRALLSEPGKLTEQEFLQLKQHPVTGADILSRFPEFALATRYVRHHHECIDGTGYPDGLTGDDIPLGARVIAVADSFDAMASARPYRHALPARIVLEEFRRKRGTQWDAAVVDALMCMIEEGRIVLSESSATPELIDRHGQVVPLPAAL